MSSTFKSSSLAAIDRLSKPQMIQLIQVISRQRTRYYIGGIMMQKDRAHIEYFMSRTEQEREKAGKASDPRFAAVHRNMASRYGAYVRSLRTEVTAIRKAIENKLPPS